jgi:hypothetical protein
VESEKRQGLYSTKPDGAREMSEEQQESLDHPDQRIYTREFKLEAVRLSESSEKTVAQIARDLGVPERALAYDHWATSCGITDLDTVA